MIACLDVQYAGTTASTAAVTFENWDDSRYLNDYHVLIEVTSGYAPGRFYRRELPPLLRVLDIVGDPVRTILVDGYCTLSAGGDPGLGAHLHAALLGGIAVVGVAKNRYRDTTHAVEVLRGWSKRPLFVTAEGMEAEWAAAHIRRMAGSGRIPDQIREVDRLARRKLL